MARSDEVQPIFVRPITPEELWLNPGLRDAVMSTPRGAEGARLAMRFEGSLNGPMTILVEGAPGSGAASQGAPARVYAARTPSDWGVGAPIYVIGPPSAVRMAPDGQGGIPAWPGYPGGPGSAGGGSVGSNSRSDGCFPILILFAILMLMALAVSAKGAPAAGQAAAGGSTGSGAAAGSASQGFAAASPARGQQAATVQWAQPTAGGVGAATQVVRQGLACVASGSLFRPVAPFCAGHPPLKGVCNPYTGMRVFYFPGQAGYNEAIVGLYRGDAYYCAFSDAVAAGYRLAPPE